MLRWGPCQGAFTHLERLPCAVSATHHRNRWDAALLARRSLEVATVKAASVCNAWEASPAPTGLHRPGPQRVTAMGSLGGFPFLGPPFYMARKLVSLGCWALN
jgi:hypothetical protein